MVEAGVAHGTNASHTLISMERIIAVGTRVLETEMKLGAYSTPCIFYLFVERE